MCILLRKLNAGLYKQNFKKDLEPICSGFKQLANAFMPVICEHSERAVVQNVDTVGERGWVREYPNSQTETIHTHT